MTNENPKCHCGKPLHYGTPFHKSMIDEMIAKYGEFIKVTVGGRSWMVQRHYIALHGLQAKELPKLGFKEVA